MKTMGAVLMALGLMSCDPGGGFVQPQKSEQLVVQIEAVPDSDIPTDGSIHILKRKQFVIEQATLFCGVDADVDPVMTQMGVRGLGIDGTILGNAFRKIGHSTQHSDGSGRQRMLDDKHCLNDGRNVIYSGQVGLNRDGQPYRLTLVVRRGDALWQGTVERSEANLHANPRFTRPMHGEKTPKNSLILGSYLADISDLSAKFVSSVFCE